MTNARSSVDHQVEEATAPTLERIRNDRERAPAQIRPLLEYLESHLFDPGLDAKRLKQACGVRDNSLPIYFHQAVSLPPYAYIEDCRMKVACRLLADTDLRVWLIAQRIGYSTLQIFSRAFERWSGVRPSVYRRLMERRSSNGEAAAASDTEEPWFRPETVMKAVLGRLEKHEADELARQLRELYPESFPPVGAIERSTVPETLEAT